MKILRRYIPREDGSFEYSEPSWKLTLKELRLRRGDRQLRREFERAFRK